ncbi:ATP-binding protein [Ekhidna sp.]|uniref:ATP-binding protein n=1 Tax=Ekhidna sp. TaxID=2608089 RepID=UPI003B514750
MRKYIFLFLITLSVHFSEAQSDRMDSLISLLESFEIRDSSYVNAINEVAFELSMTDQQQSIYYINQAISISKNIGYEQGLIRATTIKGSSFLVVGLPDQALSYYLEALTYNVEKFPLDHVRLNNNIGEVYRRKGVFDSSLAYFNRALTLAQTKLPQYQPVIIYSNLGEVSLMKNEVEMAERYFRLCLDNAVSSDHFRGIGYGYYGLAECAFIKELQLDAIDLMRKSIINRKIADHKRGLIQSYLKMGDYFNHYRSYPDSAVFYWKNGESLAKSFEANDLLNEAYEKLYSFLLEQNKISEAAYYLEKHKNLGDSIRNAEFISNVEKMKAALQSELIATENRLLKQQQQQLKVEEEARLMVIILVIIIVGGLAYSTYQYQKRQKRIKDATIESQFTNTLLQLSKNIHKDDLNLKLFIDELLHVSRLAIKCDRATYWIMDNAKQSMVLNGISARNRIPRIPRTEISFSEFPVFFNDFIKSRTLAVNQISKDERLVDIYSRYFKEAEIESILNAPIIIDGEFAGMISYSMVRNVVREWSVNEERYIASLTDLIIAAIAKNRSNTLEFEKVELIQKLKSRNKSLQEFNSVISHNLREPLTQIIGFSDLLKNEKEVKVSDDIVDRIGIASNRIDKVIKELSTVLNVRDPEPSDYREISFERIIKEVLDLLKPELKSKNVTIEQHLDVKKIKSFRPFLVDVFYHILSNSLKFSDPSKRLKIDIKTYQDELHKYVVISDNGRGMDLDKVNDHLFKMYQRFHLDVDGRGMGLFIVKSRVNTLNGWVRIESEEGLGTAVTMEFPLEDTLVKVV